MTTKILHIDIEDIQVEVSVEYTYYDPIDAGKYGPAEPGFAEWCRYKILDNKDVRGIVKDIEKYLDCYEGRKELTRLHEESYEEEE